MQKLRPLRPTARPLRASAVAAPLRPLGQIPENSGMRVLDFDLENRPLSYWYDGRCTAEVTAIACRFIGEEERHVWLLGVHRAKSMLEEFRQLYDEADMVTGHYIRRHDLPIINAALIENERPPLAPKLTSDTRLDLVRFGDLAKSQEALGAMFGLEAPKEKMTQTDWREANRLTPDGLRQTMRRVMGDVDQHIQLRQALLERGLLGAPRMWRSGGVRVAA
jgi:hypothetical protein